MTIKEDLEKKLAEIDAKWNAERAPVQVALDNAGSWMGQEWEQLESWVKGLLAHKPTTSEPPPPPAAS